MRLVLSLSLSYRHDAVAHSLSPVEFLNRGYIVTQPRSPSSPFISFAGSTVETTARTDEQTAFLMIGRGISHLKPTASVPPWIILDDLTVGNFPSSPFPVSGVPSAGVCLPLDESTLAALQFYPAHEEEVDFGAEALAMVDAYASDEFRIYDFKVKMCGRGRSHDWADCPFAHPGEKARRRDLRKHSYSGTPCSDFRKSGGCKRGDACELAHGVFECWLHPDRYRTQPCKDGIDCRRRVCFFAHTADQLRVLQPSSLGQIAAVPESYDGSPLRHQSCLHSYFSKSLVSSPTSTLISPPKSPPTESPPISPSGAKLLRASWPASSGMNEIVASLRQLQLNRAESMPSSRGLYIGNTGFVSPRGAAVGFDTAFRSLPSTPVGVTASWPDDHPPVALRGEMFERLSKDCIFDEAEAAPDVEWVSELLK